MCGPHWPHALSMANSLIPVENKIKILHEFRGRHNHLINSSSLMNPPQFPHEYSGRVSYRHNSMDFLKFNGT